MINVGVIFGSRTVEHDVSIAGAYGIMKALRRTGKYEVFPIYITQSGKWVYSKDFEDINNFKNLDDIEETNFKINFSKSGKLYASQDTKGLLKKTTNLEIDVVIPVLHGFFGEDGTVQGLLDLLQVPYASPSVIGSAVGMNKTIMKNVFASHGLSMTKYLVFNNGELDLEKIKKSLSYPLFVKPTNLGSSIGVSKVNNDDELKEGAELAYHYDNEIMVEEAVSNLKELNCCVMEKDGELITSVVEEPVSRGDFLDFNEKYTSDDGGTMQGVKNKVKIPADISDVLASDIQQITKTVYKALKCNGGAPRIDFLYDSKNGELYVNEINSIPGTLHVHLWIKSGISVPDFLDAIINTAIKKNEERKLNIDFKSNIIDYTIGFKK